MTTIPKEIFDFFASNPLGPALSVPREAANKTSPIYHQLNDFLLKMPAGDVARLCEDPSFRSLHEGRSDIERQARIWIAQGRLGDEIARQRLEVLRADTTKRRPNPYQIEALRDVDVDADHLVTLSEFDFDGYRLLRNGYAFLILATTPSPNSTYWLLRAISDEGLSESTRVRLDPFLFGPSESFRPMAYKMWMYGCPLDWERIASLRQTEHGRWQEPSEAQTRFTDFSWSPRDGEVHFACEEIPALESVQTEASRYFHAVYLPRSEKIEHLDGAIRLYTRAEIDNRHKTHVRHAGKVGIREKIFRTQGAIPRDSFSLIAQTFFVWNEDVETYFNHGCVTNKFL